MVGTVYQQESREKAKVLGIRYASRRLETMVDQILHLQKIHERVVLFCSRGGYRSGPMVQFLNALNIPVVQLEGGYKSHRHYVINYLNQQSFHHRFIVLHGYTGAGKTEILRHLQAQNQPVMDLEKMANHSGSVFGFVGQQESGTTQKQFEADLVHNLIACQGKTVFIESESARIGTVTVPKPLLQQMNEGLHVLVKTPMDERIKRLVHQYCHQTADTMGQMEEALLHLARYLGHDHVRQLQNWLLEEQYEAVAASLLTDYYDPLYRHAIQKYAYDLELTYDTINEAVEILSNIESLE